MKIKNLNVENQIQKQVKDFLCGFNTLKKELEKFDQAASLDDTWKVYEKGSSLFVDKIKEEIKPFLESVPPFKRDDLLKEALNQINPLMLQNIDKIRREYPNYLAATREDLELRNGEYLFTSAFEKQLDQKAIYQPSKEEAELLESLKSFLTLKKELEKRFNPLMLQSLTFEKTDSELITLILNTK